MLSSSKPTNANAVHLTAHLNKLLPMNEEDRPVIKRKCAIVTLISMLVLSVPIIGFVTYYGCSLYKFNWDRMNTPYFWTHIGLMCTCFLVALASTIYTILVPKRVLSSKSPFFEFYILMVPFIALIIMNCTTFAAVNDSLFDSFTSLASILSVFTILFAGKRTDGVANCSIPYRYATDEEILKHVNGA